MNLKDIIKTKEWAWRTLLLDDKGELNEAGKVIMKDLREYCRALKSPFDVEQVSMARNVGRLEVFQRIMTFLHYDSSKFYDLDEETYDE